MKERYAVVAPLGSGAYGSVYKCLDRDTGSLCALKVINLAHQEPVVMRLTMRELRTLQKLPKHPHIVELKDAFKSSGSGRVFLVFSCEGRSMHEEAENYARYILPGPMLRQVAWQLLQALVHLHEHQIIHRDIKPGNILLAGDGTGGAADVGRNGADVHIRLADFGFARSWQPHEAMSSYVATRWFRAPEILVRGKYGFNSDCWSVGCTIGELAVGSALFPGTSTIDQLARIMRATGPLPASLASQMMADRALSPLAAQQRQPPKRTLRERLPVEARLFEFLSACLQVDPAKRPSAKELMQMPYFWDVVPRSRALPKAPLQAIAAARDAAAAQIAAAEASVANSAAQPAAAVGAAPKAAAHKNGIGAEALVAAAAPGACGAAPSEIGKGDSRAVAMAGGAVDQAASTAAAAPMPPTPAATEAQTMSLSAVACSQQTPDALAAASSTASARPVAAPAQSPASEPAASMVVSVKATATGGHAATAAAGPEQPKPPVSAVSFSTGGLATLSPALVPTASSSQDIDTGAPTSGVPELQEQQAAAPSAEPPPRVVCVHDLTSVSALAGVAGPEPARAAPAPVAAASPEQARSQRQGNERELQPPQAPVQVVTSTGLLPIPVAVAVSSPFTLVSAADAMGAAAAAGGGAAAARASGGDITPHSHTGPRILDMPSNTVEMFMSPATSVAMQRLLPAVMTPVGAPPLVTPSAAVRMRQLMPHCRAPAGVVPPVLTYGILSRGSTLELDMPGGAAAAASSSSGGVVGGSEDGYRVPGVSGASAGQLQGHLQIQMQMQQQAMHRYAAAAAAVNRTGRRTGRASVEFAPLPDRLAWPQAGSQPDRTVSGAGTSERMAARAAAPGGAAGAASVSGGGGGGGTTAANTRCVTSAAVMRRSWRLLPYNRTSSGLPLDAPASVASAGDSPGLVPASCDEPAVATPSLQTSGAAIAASGMNAVMSLGRRNSRSQASFVRSVSRMSQCHATPSGALDLPAAGRDGSVDGSAGGFASAYAMANASVGATSSPLAGLVAAPHQPAKPQQLQVALQRNVSTAGGAVARSPPMLHGLVLAPGGESPSQVRRAASAVLPAFIVGSTGAHASPVTFAGSCSNGTANVAAAAAAGFLRSSPQPHSQQQHAAAGAAAGPYGQSRLANAASSTLCDYPSGEAVTPTAGTTWAGAPFANGMPTGTMNESGAGRRALMGGTSWQVLQAVGGCSSNVAAASAATACFDSAASATVATAHAGAVSLDVMLATAGGGGGGHADHNFAASSSAVARFPSASLLTAGGGAVSGAYVPHVITEDEDELAYAAAADVPAAGGEAAGLGHRAGHLHDTADGCGRLVGAKDTQPAAQSTAGQSRSPTRLASPGGQRQGALERKRRPGLLARLFGCGRFDRDLI
ncbi:hypothetical protein HXX76_006923 [Chlamydomonas incerta]|uniref:Protein kinase domain-containing protein n=1 Tax=Chlamydomonas incerta TaxID=51695 RepID=A0A835TCK8_CHLIN|nr:hypothetical protein HXX76_006923 [Chlamydomonas incerta]|eukprot:KAG2435726.1 hypothetical protein HXX76_006923 [Chlamydomonas incerta]